MADVVITGAGIIGLSTAMLLAKDGHRVTVLERDPDEPPDPSAAWDTWRRQGVNQFRMLHFFLPRFYAVSSKELPELPAALEAAGALRMNPLRDAPEAVTGGFREGDEIHTTLTARRPVAESVLAALASTTPRVEVRRGVAVTGVVTGASAASGVPHVVGVRTGSGDDVRADLVVEATGRRSPLPAWLAAAGARPPLEEQEDCGFVYYGRHFRSADGSLPLMFGSLLQEYGSLSVLTLPADNGTWGVGIITSARDAPLRTLRDPERWHRVLRSFPLVAHWADGEPLEDAVQVMAKIEDRSRRFVVDGTPVATGVVAVADSCACTNPSLGRGMSIGLLHAVALRDLLRTAALDDPGKLALAWDDATESVVMPWYRATLHFDRHRLAEIEAVIAGAPYEPDDREWDLAKALQHGAMRDPEVLRAFLSVVGLQQSTDELFASPELVERVFAAGGGWRDAPRIGPDREQLLALLTG